MNNLTLAEALLPSGYTTGPMEPSLVKFFTLDAFKQLKAGLKSGDIFSNSQRLYEGRRRYTFYRYLNCEEVLLEPHVLIRDDYSNEELEHLFFEHDAYRAAKLLHGAQNAAEDGIFFIDGDKYRREIVDGPLTKAKIRRLAKIANERRDKEVDAIT